MDTNPIFEYEPLWNNWRIESLIGEGSFGSVYKVYREEMGQRYYAAVKIISIPTKDQLRQAEATLGHDTDSFHIFFEDMVKGIINEIKLLYSLSGNSNIINYQDHQVVRRKDELGWDILIRMEYVISLPEFLKTNQVTRGDLIRLGIDICSALEICSKKGIIHRDVKEENIFVNDDGIFKLGDFGIAKELSGSSRASSMRGTPFYMAPEVYRGEKYDLTVDIYSLGLVMYKLLNHGRLPFMPPFPAPIRYRDSEIAIEKRLDGTLLPLPDQAEDELGQIIVKACEYDRSKRYSTSLAFKSSLISALKRGDAKIPIDALGRSSTPSSKNGAIVDGHQLAKNNERFFEQTTHSRAQNNTLDKTDSAFPLNRNKAPSPPRISDFRKQPATAHRSIRDAHKSDASGLEGPAISLLKSSKGLMILIIIIVLFLSGSYIVFNQFADEPMLTDYATGIVSTN